MSELQSGDCGICVYSDGEQADFFQESFVIARKPHQCCECRREIPKGERHERVVGKWDGHFDEYRTCLICREIRRAFCCDGWTYSMLWEEIYDQLFPDLTTGCLAKLETAAAKTYLLERWREWKEL